MTLFQSKKLWALWLGCICSQAVFAAETVYQDPDEFLGQNLPGCQKKALWLNAEVKAEAERLIDHSFAGVRVRYCQKDGKTAWILDEIGKTEPITSGIIVNQGTVERVSVLIFRESRGSEVHRDVFTRQYENAQLADGRQLDRQIDGITGATLSVWALTRQVKLALLFDRVSREKSNDH